MNPLPDLSVAIVSADTQLVLACLRSIRETTHEITFSVYVAINSPADADRMEEAIHSQFPEIQIVRNLEELGFSRSNNRILQECRARYVLLLNDDTIVHECALQRMVKYMDEHGEVGALGCKILNPDGTLQWSCGKSAIHKWEYFRSGVLRTLLSPLVRDQFFHSVVEVSWLTGACLMVRSEALKAAGLLDERFYMYYEDGDWCFRIIQAGWKIVYFPDAEIVHLRNQTNLKRPALSVSSYYRSRLYFFSKHFSASTCLLVRVLTVCDAMVGFLKSSIRMTGRRNPELLQAYVGAMKLALTYRAE